MKVMTILGSPRKGGNTATVLDWVEDELRANHHVVDRANMVDYRVQGCMECYRCQGVSDEPGCSHDDDGNALFKRMISADVILIASPLFCWGFSSQIKPLIDRCYCLVTGYNDGRPNSLIENKRAVLLVTAAGPIEGNADLISETFRRFCDYLRCDFTAQLVVPFCSTRDALGEDVQARAKELAAKIMAVKV